VLAALLSLLAAAAVAAPDAPPDAAPDGPIATATNPPAVSDAPAPAKPAARKARTGKTAAKPKPATKASPAAAAAGKTLAFDPKTKVDGETLQLILGQRAAFRLGDKGEPVLDAAQDGRLAAAHPDGQVQETFQPPEKGTLAVALDGSAEKRATFLKVWNGLDHPVEYRAIVLVLRGQTLTPVPVAVCPVAAGGVSTQSWPAPIVAVGLARFKAASKEALAQKACNQGG
jgi:hypothetical protein